MIPAYLIIYLLLLSFAAAFTPLWLDELHQLVGTYHRSLPLMLQWALESPGGTPLNFLAQKLILDSFGFSSLSVRLPSILFGVGALYVFIRIAREYTSQKWIAAAALFAFLPQLFRYAVEARPYSQGLFFAIVAFYFWLRLEKNGARRDAIAFGLAVAAGLYSQVFSVFIALGEAAWSLRNPKARWPVAIAIISAAAAYLPWFLAQRATQAVTHTMSNYAFSWQQISPQGYLREISGGGYFCSVPLLILAAFGRDPRLWWLAFAGLAAPVAADATLGYFFAGRQLIFALPFLILLAVKGAVNVPRWAAIALFLPLFVASMVVDFRQATTAREDWATPAHQLASKPGSCTYIWSPDLLKYLQIYEPSLSQCDLSTRPAEILYVTTRYSPLAPPPQGYDKIRSERVGVTEIALYRRDASLKTYGLFRFVFRP